MSKFEKVTVVTRFYLPGLYQRLGEHNDFLLGGGLAFSLMICLLPLVLIVFSILWYFLEALLLQRRFLDVIDTAVPYSDSAEYLKKIIESRIAELKDSKHMASIVGVVGFFFAASGLFTNMRNIANRIYRISGIKSPVLAKLRDLGMVVLVLLFFVLLMMLVPLVETLKYSANGISIFRAIRVSGGSPADEAGLQRGDLIQEVDRQAVRTVDELQKLLANMKSGDSAALLVRRGQNTFFVAIQIT